MQVRVLFFGIVRERVGLREQTLDIPPGTHVSGLLERLAAFHPKFGQGAGWLRVAVNEEYVDSDTLLCENDEVAIIPPVSGGIRVQNRYKSHFAG